MPKDTWPVEKLVLAVISGMIMGRGSKSNTQTNNAVETTDFDRPHHWYQMSHKLIIPYHDWGTLILYTNSELSQWMLQDGLRKILNNKKDVSNIFCRLLYALTHAQCTCMSCCYVVWRQRDCFGVSGWRKEKIKWNISERQKTSNWYKMP